MSWLSKEEVESMLAPDPAHTRAARQLVARHGGSVEQVVGSDKLVVAFPASGDRQPPAAFLAELATTEGVEAHLAFDVESWERPSTRSVAGQTLVSMTPAAPADPNGPVDPQKCLSDIDGVTPTCIRTAYGLDDAASVEASQAFVVNQGFLDSDVSKFQSDFGLPSQPVTEFVGERPSDGGDEASLDAEYIMATGQGVPTTYVWLDGSQDNPFTNWLVWAGNATDDELPKVHSLSLGAAENEVGAATMSRMNTEMAAMGARGVSIVFASGDSGWQPQQKFGAASPYVTAVGGIWNGGMRNGDLQADSLTTGGFAASSQNKAGDWQAAAIAHFVDNTTGLRPDKIDPTQRCVPDVSAYDDEILVVYGDGYQGALSGTSAACPMVAGMLASINGALAAAGHDTTLGFANPFLYANQDAFLDITKGYNRGFSAVEGYDPVSGLGTFSTTTYSLLKEAALAAAGRRVAMAKAN
mmetsp:Transcript_51993/g.145044  ORF Transcript_51993/g.145044 Transcript_51993/m.145044 type:complete len:469 (-) Transcript_51993:141-1547(-)